MCGRFVIDDDGNFIQAEFGLAETPTVTASYNVAPTQSVLAIGQKRGGTLGTSFFKWGLVPSWAKDTKGAAKLINARSETVAEKPSFRSAFEKRRCIIPMSGYYEWKKDQDGSKQPVYIHLPDQKVFGVAGLWEIWQPDNGKKHYSCTLLTTEANELTQAVHHRMPVILSKEDYRLWIDKDSRLVDLNRLFLPYSSEKMTFFDVSKSVNKVANNSADLIQRVA